MSQMRGREVMESSIPDLAIGPGKTRSNALHREVFVGQIRDWTTFNYEVTQFYSGIDWRNHQKVISYRPGGNASASNIFRARLSCGDEADVQCRFNSNVAIYMSAICDAAGVDMTLGSFKTCLRVQSNSGIPDVVCRTNGGGLRVVGEVKTPWIMAHKLARAKASRNMIYKKLLGQIAGYMQEGKLKYGFITNYHETIFVKQEVVNGQWCLFVSDVVSSRAVGSLSLRSCFWWLANRAVWDFYANNNLPRAQWVQG